MKLLEKVKLTVGFKLIGMITVLLSLSLISVVWFSNTLFVQDKFELLYQVKQDRIKGLRNQIHTYMEQNAERARIFGLLLESRTLTADTRASIIREFFNKKDEILGVFVYSSSTDGKKFELSSGAISPDLETYQFSEKKLLEEIKKIDSFSLASVFLGDQQVTSVKLTSEAAAIVFAFPFIQRSNDSFSHILTVLIHPSQFQKLIQSESDVSLADQRFSGFIIDRDGTLLAHSELSRVVDRDSVAYLPIVKEGLASNDGNVRQLIYEKSKPGTQSGKKSYIATYAPFNLAGLALVVETPFFKATESALKVRSTSAIVLIIVLSLAVLAGYLFSGTITWPIRKLVEASAQIASGDFKIDLKPRYKDEISHLAYAFNGMAKGLEEREKYKTAFSKYHDPVLVEKILSGASGEKKTSVIFFSDIRGFTSFSETLPAEKVVEILNEYISLTVNQIRQHGGVIDKLVGDAVMGLWGIPVENKDDIENALKACLAIRQDIYTWNTNRIALGKPAIRIGMGLNYGSVVAGKIGSEDKMDYTVIGDTVNIASRLEELTKNFGSDLIVSQTIAERLKNKFVFQSIGSVEIRGKSQALEVFKVLGFYNQTGNEVIIETPYSSYQPKDQPSITLMPGMNPPPFKKKIA